ncbi:hypothetical protein KP509_30G046600 [Ceratopteris richardii]|uniref:AP2/ERF domain-containing protein n=1 Tax=Ceratopteris richardii TaxID=49495 RepID=A0A8T2R3U0_CERRI|nr:hypothetical protein KP509_30G046600 [Ceratopteris richardii]
MTSSSTSSTSHVGRRGPSRQRLPRFRGVRRRSWGSWVAEIRVPNSPDRLSLGSYQSIDQAARAYDVANLCFRGPSAGPLNLPSRPLSWPSKPPSAPGPRRGFVCPLSSRHPRTCSARGSAALLSPPYLCSCKRR